MYFVLKPKLWTVTVHCLNGLNADITAFSKLNEWITSKSIWSVDGSVANTNTYLVYRMHMLVLFFCDVCMPFLGTYLSSILGRLSLRTVVVQRLLKFHIKMSPFLPRSINPLSHFKCLDCRGSLNALDRVITKIHFSLGDSKLNRITFHWNPGKGDTQSIQYRGPGALVHFHYLPKTCQESNPQKLTDDGSVVFVALLSQNHIDTDTWCWRKSSTSAATNHHLQLYGVCLILSVRFFIMRILMYGQRRFFQNQRPPLKTNMELEITPLEKEKHWKITPILGFNMLVFGGCTPTKNPSFQQPFVVMRKSPNRYLFLESGPPWEWENGGTFGMVQLITKPIYTLYSGYLWGIPPINLNHHEWS